MARSALWIFSENWFAFWKFTAQMHKHLHTRWRNGKSERFNVAILKTQLRMVCKQWRHTKSIRHLSLLPTACAHTQKKNHLNKHSWSFFQLPFACVALAPQIAKSKFYFIEHRNLVGTLFFCASLAPPLSGFLSKWELKESLFVSAKPKFCNRKQ